MSRARAVLGICAVGLLLALPLSSAYAGAFSIYEQGARAMGRASAFAACPSDPSAMFYNPAGLAMLDGTQIYVGATAIIPSGDFDGTGPLAGISETQASQFFLPPNLYISHRLNDQIVLGLGLHTPFGLGTKWEDPPNYTGRYLAHETSIAGVAINPTVAFSVNDQLSVGVGVDIRLSTLLLKRWAPPQDLSLLGLGTSVDIGKAELETDMANGIGFNAGALFEATDQLSIGLAYRSKVEVDYEGTATVTQISTGVPAADTYLAGLGIYGDFDVSTTIAYPSILTAGVAYKVSDQLLAEVDVNYVGWSAFKELAVESTNASLAETIPEDYEDSITVRVGAEYWQSDTMALRVGYLYDQTPVPNKSITPLLPDATRNGVTAGIGMTFGSLNVDAAFMYLMFGDADTNGEHPLYNGIYKNSALLFALNVGYAIGK